VNADVSADDDRLAVEAMLEAAQDVARALPVLAPHDLERDAPADALAEAALDFRGPGPDDEEGGAPPRRGERLERALEKRDARERQESRHDARSERAERRAVAVGEEDGRHGGPIMAAPPPRRERTTPARRPRGPSSGRRARSRRP
jgi:hypothetical protein